MKLLIRKMIKYLMVPVGAVYSMFKPPKSLTVLMYHRVNDEVNKEISVKVRDFYWQMAYLKRKGYQVLTLDDALRPIHINRSNKKEKFVVLTFDDGYEDFCMNAYPILRKFGFSSLVYLVPGFIETDKVFWWDNDLGESKLLSWKQIERLENAGLVRFGSHSANHPDFDLLNELQTEEELRSSKEMLEAHLRNKVGHFAYPRGIVTPAAKKLMPEVYDTAVSIFDGYEFCHENWPEVLTQIKRLPVQRSDGRHLFGPRLKGWLAPEEWLKKRLKRH